MRLSFLISLLPLVAASPAGKRAEPAPVLSSARGDNKDIIADKYIVKFKDGSPLALLKEAFELLDEKPTTVYSEGVFIGFAGKMSGLALEAIRHHPDVEYIEQASLMSAQGYVTQGYSSWGPARISHRKSGSNQYNYDESAGEGTCSYIIDSGIDADHPEFEGRATDLGHWGSGPDHDDCLHGTHVAGIIGSKTYGVAKKTKLFGLKVLSYSEQDGGGCLGDNSDIIAGVNAVANDAAKRRCPNGVIVNMSLGGGYSRALNDAVDNLARRGIFVAVAAGNKNKDASGVSPASAKNVCCVGGTDSSDHRYVDSNYGANVAVAAPGVVVLSTFPNGRTGYMTGTSMATPHVAGLAAYLAAKDGISGPGICSTIQESATANAIVDQIRGTKNLIAFNGNPRG
ncbi:oryzin precursor [Beauveria brongniartii RCEF 3172]|uniref:Oryzin n=1 Tax=Beauveria brongniartii RCEF 3172 TaxID=1081107 RepID=A0A162JZQ4_9HYPO|nr:oryzin precursor [Beauveria brongniartii RCEF 3172]